MKVVTPVFAALVVFCLGAVAPAAELVSAYTFDETGGTTASDAIRGIAGDATALGGTTWVAGAIGGGVRVDGVDGWLSAANPIANGATAMSFSGWVNAEALPVWGSIVKNWGGAQAGQFHFGLQSGDQDLSNFLSNDAGGVSNVRQSTAFPTGEWVHVAFTYDGTSHKLFRNGTKITEGAFAGGLNYPLAQQPASGVVGFGVKTGDDGLAPDPGAPGFWQGSFDEFGFWDGALSEAEVMDIYTNGVNGISIVPEPSSSVLALLGCLSALGSRRRRGAKTAQ